MSAPEQTGRVVYVEVGMISGEPDQIDRDRLLTEVTANAVKRGRLQRGGAYHFEIGSVPPVHVETVAAELPALYDNLSVAGMDQLLAHHREHPTWWLTVCEISTTGDQS